MKLQEFVLNEQKGNSILSDGLRQINSYLGDDLYKLDEIERAALYHSEEGIHNDSHIERVILLGTLLSAKEGLEKNDFLILLTALKYHDIGRVDDFVDDEHGARGAKLLANLYCEGLLKDVFDSNELKIIQSAITLHSVNDLYLNDKKEINPRLHKIASLLKDADNLDRVRLANLDIRYLRSRHAKTIVPFAEQLFLYYLYK